MYTELYLDLEVTREKKYRLLFHYGSLKEQVPQKSIQVWYSRTQLPKLNPHPHTLISTQTLGVSKKWTPRLETLYCEMVPYRSSSKGSTFWILPEIREPK